VRGDRIDNNQNEIVKQLRQIPGISVEVGHDDILVGYRGKTYWYEIKDPDTVSPKTKEVRPSAITESEKKRRDTFKGHYEIVWNIDQIISEIF
jgi:hypothetical protein